MRRVRVQLAADLLLSGAGQGILRAQTVRMEDVGCEGQAWAVCRGTPFLPGLAFSCPLSLQTVDPLGPKGQLISFISFNRVLCRSRT